jgi:periplasmic mercuric ion binding protein
MALSGSIFVQRLKLYLVAKIKTTIMKTILFISLFSLISLTSFTQSIKTTDFKVYGNCGMCESRIEKAAKIDGVSSAEWSQETKMLTLQYDTKKVNLDDVHQKIADAGHDTEKVRASDETYSSLPACCHYDRPEQSKYEGEEEMHRHSPDH